MNNSRRKELRRIIESFENEKQQLDIVINNEQDSFDNLTDSLQQTMRGQQMEEYIDKMNEAIVCIEDAIELIEEVIYNGLIN